MNRMIAIDFLAVPDKLCVYMREYLNRNIYKRRFYVTFRNFIHQFCDQFLHIIILSLCNMQCEYLSNFL